MWSFIIKPHACCGEDISVEVYQLLLFSIIPPWCTLHHLGCGINSKSTECKVISCRKVIITTLALRQWHCSIFINKFEKIEYLLLMLISLDLNS